MTNLDPKKNELTEEQLDNIVGGATHSGTVKDETRSNEIMLVIPLETTELNDEELDQVAGGSKIRMCWKCGTQVLGHTYCPNCGKYNCASPIHVKS